MTPPKRKWLICWDGEFPDDPDKGTDNYYFAFYDEDECGSFWMKDEGGAYCQIDAPKHWKEVPK